MQCTGWLDQFEELIDFLQKSPVYTDIYKMVKVYIKWLPHYYRTITALLPHYYRTITALLPHYYRTLRITVRYTLPHYV
jgi:hypothetical protein